MRGTTKLALFVLLFGAASSWAEAPRTPAANRPVPVSAWDVLVATEPLAALQAFNAEERAVLDALEPDDARRFLAGDDPASLPVIGGGDLGSVIAALGQGTAEELTFVPLEPCRIADTRLALGPFGDGETRHFVVRGVTTDYSPQGGDPNGCGIPDLSEGVALSNVARAVLLSFQVLGAGIDGELRSWPANYPQPAVPLAHYEAVFGRAISGETPAIVRMCDEVGVDPCIFGDLRASLTRGAHLVIDVHGYFLAGVDEVVPGPGLLGGGGDGSVSLSVDFAGTGTADTAARSDHFHAESVPPGAIVMWSGGLADIPAGWALCDGTNGTPDLQDRFVLGAGIGEEPGAVGGAHSYSLTLAQLAPHGHALSIDPAGSHAHSYVRPLFAGAVAPLPGLGGIPWNIGTSQTVSTGGVGNHTHTGTVQPAGKGAPIDNRPAFYELAFIMKL